MGHFTMPVIIMLPTSANGAKSGHSAVNEDDDVEGAFEDILAPKHVPPLATSSQATQPSSEINVSIIDALHSLSNDVQGLKDKVRTHRDKINSWLSTLEM
ncbi:hypothetical protein PVK06_004570 [Gossypium arboreum]|uniref:Uncharacterized protein n=1 Tax=Gossypium arboreum TaxID=29729 RepID=A0ABR0QSD4_GOSAR|nr:hypothetical protein PVK06_004570 [Gossypium arboreum]